MNKKPKPDLVWQKLQNILAHRAHSEKELTQKLAQSFNKEQVQSAIKRAKQNKWLEKPEDMALKVEESLNRKKKGWLYIKHALKKRGLPLLSKNPNTEKEKALYWISKKELRGDMSKKEEASLYRFLNYRGFESKAIKEALQQHKSQYK